MKKILVLTSDDANGSSGQQPRKDLPGIARAAQGEMYHIKKAAQRGMVGKLIFALRLLSLGAFSKSVCAFLSPSELIGIPVALGKAVLHNHIPHIMVGHKLYTPQRIRMIRQRLLLEQMNQIVVITRKHQEILRGAIPGGYAQRVIYHPHAIDEQFFRSTQNADGEYILAVGLELRDYATLIPALEQAGLPARILASSSWSPKGTRPYQGRWPDNIQRMPNLSYVELRRLYEQARFIVLALVPTVQGAGATAALEAMAMGKAVIASDVPGIVDYVRNEQNGILVAPENVEGLSEAIKSLWFDLERAMRLGREGRGMVEQEFSLDDYIQFFASMLGEIAH